MGSVLIWHMYCPLSSSCTFLMCRFHVVWSLWDTDTRGLCVITWSWIAWIALVSAFTHPTCANICQPYLLCASCRRAICGVWESFAKSTETKQMKYQYTRWYWKLYRTKVQMESRNESIKLLLYVTYYRLNLGWAA